MVLQAGREAVAYYGQCRRFVDIGCLLERLVKTGIYQRKIAAESIQFNRCNRRVGQPAAISGMKRISSAYLPVFYCREIPPCGCQVIQISAQQMEPVTRVVPEPESSPGIYDHAMAMGFTPIDVEASWAAATT